MIRIRFKIRVSFRIQDAVMIIIIFSITTVFPLLVQCSGQGGYLSNI